MNPTHLKYLEQGSLFQDQATIIDIITREDGKMGIVLDHTILYPQGGGQPFDFGTIKKDNALFRVDEVRFHEGVVYHFGTLESGSFAPNDSVIIEVDEPRRKLHSRIHSAGHLVDIALDNLGKLMKPTKGYHFPQGAYVEYEGTLDEEVRNQLQHSLEKEINKIIQAALPIEIKILSLDELKKISAYIPDDLPTNKPTRVMIVQGYPAIPCGGTHVQNTQEIGKIIIDKIKNKKGSLRVSYSVQ